MTNAMPKRTKPTIWRNRHPGDNGKRLWACSILENTENDYTGFGWSPAQAYRSWLLRERFPDMRGMS